MIYNLNLILSRFFPRFSGLLRALGFMTGLIVIGITYSPARASRPYLLFSYWLILASVVCWLIVFIRWCHQTPELRSLLKRNVIVLSAAFLATLITFATVKPALRVLADEAYLISMSRNISLQKHTDQIETGLSVYGEFKPLSYKAPDRHLLFPFLLSVIHLIKGFDYRNVYILNFLALFSLLSLIGIWVRRVCGSWAALAGILLVISQPVVALASTSGGYDLVFCLSMLVCMATLYVYLKKPSEVTFDLMWMSLVLQTQTRGESFIFTAIILVLLAASGRLNTRHLGSSPFAAATPLLLLPLIWTMSLSHASVHGLGYSETDRFALASFIKNNVRFFSDQFRFKMITPYANAVNVIGLIAGAFAAVRLARRWRSTPAALREIAVIAGAVVLGRWVLMTSWFWSDPYAPACYRLYLLPVIFLSASAAFGIHALWSRRPGVPVAIALALWVIYFPLSINSAKNWTLDVWREYRVVTDYLNRLPDQDFVLISSRPFVYTIYKYGSVDFAYAISNRHTLFHQKEKHKIGDILVLQPVFYSTMEPHATNELGSEFKLKTLYEKQVAGYYFIRISKVVD